MIKTGSLGEVVLALVLLWLGFPLRIFVSFVFKSKTVSEGGKKLFPSAFEI